MDESLIGNILGGLINRDGDNNNCMGNGGWWIILLMIFFWGGNGFGGWGNAGAQAAMANYATQADITNGFNFEAPVVYLLPTKSFTSTEMSR